MKRKRSVSRSPLSKTNLLRKILENPEKCKKMLIIPSKENKKLNNLYQSIAYYHYTNNLSNDPYLVINLNNCSYGICECSPNSSELLYTDCMNVSLWTMYHTLLEKYTKDIYAVVQQQFNSSNQAINKAIEENDFQQVIYHFEDQDLTLYDLDSILNPLKLILYSFLDEACHHIEDPQHINIVVIGTIHASYLIRHYLKEYFTKPPFKSNQCIITSSKSFIRLGCILLEADMKEEDALILHDHITNRESIVLYLDEEKGNRNKRPYFLTKTDTLYLRINNQLTKIDIPRHFCENLVDIGYDHHNVYLKDNYHNVEEIIPYIE